MARGWESKSVEDQIAGREEAKESSKIDKLTPQQREIEQKRNQLLMMRARALSMDPRQQEEALKYLDAELARIATL